MFSILITSNGTAWETDQLMRMERARFKEYSGAEGALISVDQPDTLKKLEEVPSLLMYERGTTDPNVDLVRYGYLSDIRVASNEVSFRFSEEGVFERAVVQEFADRLGLHQFEQNRTHWAVKDGGLPSSMLARLRRSYDVVFSFAGEDRNYVEQVAAYLRARGVKIFYDEYEEVRLWGKDLSEHFDLIYRLSGRYCVLFISEHYVRKVWTKHERRSAIARALQEHGEYILPARFDATEVPGILPTVAYVSLAGKIPTAFAELLLQKLRGTSVAH
jgi:hypothetical protein